MSAQFRRTRRGIELTLAPGEARVLASLLTELDNLLDDGAPASDEDPLAALVGLTDQRSGAPSPPTDPALARLLPDGYLDDAEAAAELRRFTEAELRAGKRGAAQAMRTGVGGGGKLLIGEDAAQMWLGALNDLRLALGTRLGVTEEVYDEIDRMPDGDPRKPPYLLYEWLGVLQETLVRALARW